MGFKFNYTYNFGDVTEMPELGPFFFFLFALCLLVSLVPYLFRAYGLYTLAKRREVPHAWLAWVPVGSEWLLGYLSDQYQGRVRGEIKSKSTLLAILSLLLHGAGILAIVLIVPLIYSLTFMSVTGLMDPNMILRLFLIGAPLLYLAVLGLSIAYLVIYYMALYDVYRSCDPTNATIYLVLSILFGIVQTILLFVCRYKDDGMKPPAPRDYQTPWQPPQPPSSSDPFQIP